MTDVVAEVKDLVDVDKEVEKSDGKDEVVAKKGGVEKNGDAAEEKTENGTEVKEESEKSAENGNVKENGVSEKEEVSTDSSDICGIKRKSEVGLESEESPVESPEKKQKLEEPAEKEVAANGS